MPPWQESELVSPNVAVQVHPDDDHYFFVGTGPSTPDGYRQPQHVDQAVIDDVATWIHRVGRT